MSTKPSAPSADLALIEEEQARHVSRQHCEQCERWCSTCGGSQKWPCRTHRLLTLAREALKGREDTARLDELEAHFARDLTTVIRSGHEHGQVLAVFHRLDQSVTLRGMADAARSAAGGRDGDE